MKNYQNFTQFVNENYQINEGRYSKKINVSGIKFEVTEPSIGNLFFSYADGKRPKNKSANEIVNDIQDFLDSRFTDKSYYFESGKNTDALGGFSFKRMPGSGDLALLETKVNEGKIIYKREYTQNHPARTANEKAAIRNAILDAIQDGVLTEDEISKVVKETGAHSRWMSRNSHYFKMTESGIRLSSYGLKVWERVKNTGAINKGRAFVAALKEAREKGLKTFEFNGKTFKVSASKVNEGRAFVAALKEAREKGSKTFEFNGKTFKVSAANVSEAKYEGIDLNDSLALSDFGDVVDSINDLEPGAAYILWEPGMNEWIGDFAYRGHTGGMHLFQSMLYGNGDMTMEFNKADLKELIEEGKVIEQN
jgi:hypothetical protein